MALFRVSHSQYVQTLSERLHRWLRRQSRRLDSKWAEAAQSLPRTRSGVLLRLNLDPARPIFAPLYAPISRGQLPYDPLCVLRALLLMLLLGYKSIESVGRGPWIKSRAGSAAMLPTTWCGCAWLISSSMPRPGWPRTENGWAMTR